MADRRIIEGDCVEQMAAMAEASVDAVVCDPPYGLEFMGKDWDRLGASATHRVDRADELVEENKRRYIASSVTYGQNTKAMQEWHEAWAREALRVLKPGGHLLAFGGTRTYHRLACAIEDAGFEIRDTICWLYGSGFPKSLDVSAAIDRAAGAEREVVGHRESMGYPDGGTAVERRRKGTTTVGMAVPAGGPPITAPATPDAERWQGWGTALKPAHEPVVVARKPLAGTVAANVLAHGTGALNVDGCRIGTDEPGYFVTNDEHRTATKPDGVYGFKDYEAMVKRGGGHDAGRWPANVVLDPEAAEALDRSVGPRSSGSRAEGVRSGLGYRGANGDGGPAIEGSTGPVSRFFYVAKASSAERNAGLDGFEAKPAGVHDDDAYVWPLNGDGTPRGKKVEPRANVHPTVKPIDLMRWLVRLVTPPDGLVLDPFTGSGSTGCAAALEGFRFVGIEREAEYAAIARARIAWWSQHPDGVELVKRLEAEKQHKAIMDAGQLGLFG